MSSVWLECPTAVANKFVEAGKLIEKWVMARVKMLSSQPVQCYRSLVKQRSM